MAPKRASGKKELEKNTSREIIKAIEKSNDKCKKEILDYLMAQRFKEYTEDDVNIVINNQKMIDKKEMEQSALGENYVSVIKTVLYLAAGVIFFVEFVACFAVLEAEILAAIKVLFIIACVCAGFNFFIIWLFDKRIKVKIVNLILVFFPLFIYVFEYFICSDIYRCCAVSSILYGILLFIGKALVQTKELNKTDAYNIMVLLFTLMSLLLGVYSVMK